MALRFLRAALLLFLLVSLGSCQVLEMIFGSVFPSTVTLLKEQLNLSGKITSDEGEDFSIRYLDAGGTRYVTLSGRTTADGNIIMFFDADLNPVMTLTGLPANGVFVDAQGKIAAGNTQYKPDLTVSLSPLPGSVLIERASSAGVDGFPVGSSNNVANMFSDTNSNQFQYSYYTGAWGTGGGQIPVALSAQLSNLSVDAVLADGDPAGKVVVVVSTSGGSSDSSTDTSYFLSYAKGAFPAGNLGVAPVDLAKHRDGLENRSFGYVNGYLIAYDKSSGSFVLIDPATAATVNSFYSHIDPSESIFAYPSSGGYYFSFDRRTRILAKYAQWW